MPHQTYGLNFHSLLKPLLSVLVLNLLLTHACRGHSQLIGPPHSILAGTGDDTILPCHLKPAMDVNSETIEWTRPDLGQRFVHVRRSGQDLVNIKNPSYKGRTSLFPDELKHGNISLKLSNVQLSDQGTYVCDIPLMNKKSYVRLVVALHTASLPVISLSGIDRNKGGVILNCDSNSWYPEPEVVWLDGEGNLLSAGPTETVRGPDDLYTVSSRVTVEKRHSNSFTCRVQQNHTNQTREAQIHVPDDFFEVLPSFSSTTVGLAVSLAVCILVILILGFFVWKFKTTRSLRDYPDKGNKNCCKCSRTEDQCVTEEEPERQQLLTDGTDQIKDLKERQAAGIRPEEEQLRRREAENRLKTLIEELESMKTEIRQKLSDLQQLREEKKKKKEKMEKLKEQLENNKTEVKKLKTAIAKHYGLPWNSRKIELQTKRKDLKNEVGTLKQQLETEGMDLGTKTKEFDDKQVEVQQLQEEMEINLESLMEELESENMEVDGLKHEVNKLTEEKKRSEEERQKWERKFNEEKKEREKAEEQVKELQTELRGVQGES